MLDTKTILQIDATIIAGIFIFLTVGSIGQNPTVPEVVNEWQNKFNSSYVQFVGNQTKLSQLTYELAQVTGAKTITQNQINGINEAPQEIQGEINKVDATINGLTRNMTYTNSTKQNEIKMQIETLDAQRQYYVKELSVLEQKIGLANLQENLTIEEQQGVGLKSQINQTNNNLQLLNQRLTDISNKFKADLAKSRSSFLKKPEDWVYDVGLPISGSAILALLPELFGHTETTKLSFRIVRFCSVFLMMVGFVFLCVIFFVIGGGPSYIPNFFFTDKDL